MLKIDGFFSHVRRMLATRTTMLSHAKYDNKVGTLSILSRATQSAAFKI